jgi:hypothetical protein
LVLEQTLECSRGKVWSFVDETKKIFSEKLRNFQVFLTNPSISFPQIKSETKLIPFSPFPPGRKSLSAMHNIDNKSSSISKSYTNSKKEELLKVINEAKQKLENVSVRRRPLTHIQRVA